MPSPGAVRAGRAYVEIGVYDRMDRGLRNAQRKLQTFGNSLRSLNRTLAPSLLVSTLAFAPIISAAGKVESSIRRFGLVFGEAAADARNFAKILSQEIGRSQVAIMNGMGTFQAFFRGLDFGVHDSAMMAKRLQAMLQDFSSFFNLSDEDGLRRFIAALAGSPEVLDQFGINLKEAALTAKRQAVGLFQVNKAYEEQAKTLARVMLIQEAVARNNIKGEASADTFANAVKRLAAAFFDLRAAIGLAVIDQIKPFALQLAGLLRKLADWAKRNSEFVASMVLLVGKVLLPSIAHFS